MGFPPYKLAKRRSPYEASPQPPAAQWKLAGFCILTLISGRNQSNPTRLRRQRDQGQIVEITTKAMHHLPATGLEIRLDNIHVRYLVDPC